MLPNHLALELGVLGCESLANTAFHGCQVSSHWKVAVNIEDCFDDRSLCEMEIHVCAHVRNTFITSSPKWLITFTAMRPLTGFANGREIALWSVDQASSLISALSVVFRAP